MDLFSATDYHKCEVLQKGRAYGNRCGCLRIGVIEQMCEKREDRLTYGTIVRQQRARQRGNSNSEEQNLNESSIAASEKQSERVQLNKWAFNNLKEDGLCYMNQRGPYMATNSFERLQNKVI